MPRLREEKPLSVQRVAGILGVHRHTVRAWLKKGVLPDRSLDSVLERVRAMERRRALEEVRAWVSERT